jgi:hypothetical protein
LNDVAEVFNGIIEGQKEESKRMLNFSEGFEILWYKGFHNVVKESFFVTHKNPLKKKYPNDFEKPRWSNRHYFTREKVLINALHNLAWGQRITVGIDRKGVFVAHNFNIVAMHEDNNIPGLTHEVIAAVLAWKVANAWIIEWQRSSNLPLSKIREIPFPKLTEKQCMEITLAVRNIENAKKNHNIVSGNDMNTIDRILTSAYQLSTMYYSIISELSDWDSNSSIQETGSVLKEDTRKVCGVVEEVNAEGGTLTIWLRGFDELQIVPIDKLIPGWLLREGVPFCTKIPKLISEQQLHSGEVQWGNFLPQEYAYLEQEQLLNSLSELVLS